MKFLLLTKEESEFDIIGQINYDFNSNNLLINQTVLHIGNFYILEVKPSDMVWTSFLLNSFRLYGYNRPLEHNVIFEGDIVDDYDIDFTGCWYDGKFINF